LLERRGANVAPQGIERIEKPLVDPARQAVLGDRFGVEVVDPIQQLRQRERAIERQRPSKGHDHALGRPADQAGVDVVVARQKGGGRFQKAGPGVVRCRGVRVEHRLARNDSVSTAAGTE
jgi:hypothetical protein